MWSGVPAQWDLTYRQLDRLARSAVASRSSDKLPFGVVVFRQATWGGAFVNLGAVDGLSRWLDVRSGRLPRTCTPSDCELIQIGGAPAAPKLPFLHVVGRAAFKPGAPLSTYFGGGGEKRPPILLADGVLPFQRTPLPDAPLDCALVRLDRPGGAALDSRLAAREPRHEARPRPGATRASDPRSSRSPRRPTRSGDPRDEPRRGLSVC